MNFAEVCRGVTVTILIEGAMALYHLNRVR